MREAAGPAQFADAQHQVRPIDPLHVAEALPAAHPDSGHAIRRREKGTIQNVAKGRVFLRLAHSMDAGDAHIPFSLLFERLRHGGHRQVEVDGADPHAQNIGALAFDLFFRPVQETMDYAESLAFNQSCDLISA